MAKYTAFVKVILSYNNEPDRIVSKQFDEPNTYIGWLDEASDAFNSEIAAGQLDSYTIIEKVNGQILDVEHVSYDARHNFVMRRTPGQ